MRNIKMSWILISAAVAGGVISYLLLRRRQKKMLAASLGAEDRLGNYGIDGVSYDEDGVIIASDKHPVQKEKTPPPEQLH